jgi:hypothetical protein
VFTLHTKRKYIALDSAAVQDLAPEGNSVILI